MTHVFAGKPKTRPLRERFMEKFVVAENGCWEWTGMLQFKEGYGLIWRDGCHRLAHRASYELFVGAMKPKDCVLHRCDNRRCVNPDHLFLGTRTDNHNDMMAKGRHVNPNSKGLTPSDVVEIRTSALNQPQLARKFGVSQVLISRIQHRKCWKRVA